MTMERPDYLSKYLFDWEPLNVILSGRSALDSRFFISSMYGKEEVVSFLKGYGIDPEDPIGRAELFGNFQEAVQFIKRYFLKENNNEDGVDLKIPNSLYMISDIDELFLMATGNSLNPVTDEERLWAEVVLKIMHTILHVDKDLRSNYFSVIQTQILDRFYKYVYRDGEKLFLGERGDSNSIALEVFETKSKKTRDSVIIKLLHKAENVAEELFDRIGIRIVTRTKFDALRVVRFLIEKNIVIPHNIKPSRSMNTLIDIAKFRDNHNNLIKLALRNNLSEDKFLEAIEREISSCSTESQDDRNKHTSSKYETIQFTCRQLIKYKNPFLSSFNEVRKMAKEVENQDLAKKVLDMDVSLIARDIRFFYPFEVQIVDEEGHRTNTEGEASHSEYKRSQVVSAMKRVFRPLAEHMNVSFTDEVADD